MAPNAGSLSGHPQGRRAPSPLLILSRQQLLEGSSPPSRDAGRGGDLPGWPLSPWWRSALDPGSVQAQHTRQGVACICFRTIFFILLFSQYLKNIALPVPTYGRRKCHTSKLHLFQVFPVRSTRPLPFLVHTPGEWGQPLAPKKMPSHLRWPPVTCLNPPVVLTMGVMPSRSFFNTSLQEQRILP